MAQSAPHPSPQESDWSDEDWNGDRQRTRQEEEKVQQWKEEEKTKGQVPNDYCPTSLFYDLPINKAPCPIVVPRRNRPCIQTTTPPNYVSEEEDAPLLVDNLVALPVSPLQEEKQGEEDEKGGNNNEEESNREEEERRKDMDKTQADSGQEVDEEEGNYLDYSHMIIFIKILKQNWTKFIKVW